MKRALARVNTEADLADHAPIEALKPEDQTQAFYTLAQYLAEDERYAAAKHSLERALALSPDEPDLHELAATLARELGDVEPAIAALQRVVKATPGDSAATRSLAELLIANDRAEEAIVLLRSFPVAGDREIETRLAEALFVHGEAAAALKILDDVCASYERQRREPWSVTDRNGLIARAQEADRLRRDVYSELHGRDAAIDLAAQAGRLDAKAGVNYRLLGRRLAAKSKRVAAVLDLQDPETTESRGRALGETAAGLALVGSAQLRRGELGAARKSFERASELDGTCAAAFLGIGAVLDHDKHRLHRRAGILPVPRGIPATVERVVPDWRALTDLERNVVWASVKPFVSHLPLLAERHVVMRVLPIDVRATDVDLFEHVSGKRAADDHRSYDALGGVATQRGAIAKVEELLAIAGDHGWTFAHEFAHLVYFHLDDERSAEFLKLFERASAIRCANIDYALKNDDELFAVTYTDYLRRRHDPDAHVIDDDAGIQSALMTYFAQICQ